MRASILTALAALAFIAGWFFFREGGQGQDVPQRDREAKIAPRDVLIAKGPADRGDGEVAPPADQVAGPAAKTAKEPVQPGRLITRLVGRKQTITIHASKQGPLYAVETNDGKVQVSNVTLDDLRVQHPDLYRDIQPLLATQNGYMWAGMEEGRFSGSR